MANFTTCPKCGKCYEEVFDELCRACSEKHIVLTVGAGILALPDDWYFERSESPDGNPQSIPEAGTSGEGLCPDGLSERSRER
jgi:hypothetical protein